MRDNRTETNRLVSDASSATPTAYIQKHGHGSELDTILNVVNIAFGAGMLGLPFAIQNAGFVTGIVGLGIVLMWNGICCKMLVELRGELVKSREDAQASPSVDRKEGDDGNEVTFAAIGNYAMGFVGACLVHTSVIMTLLGAAAAYLINANTLLRKTPFYLFPDVDTNTAMYINTVLYMACMYPVTCVRSLAPLSKLSFPAILALVAGFAVVIRLGLDMYGWPELSDILAWDALYVPRTFAGFSNFFGVAVFSYGATIIIVEIQQSMEAPRKIMHSLNLSLWFIWLSYSILGGLTIVIFQQQDEKVHDNIMDDLGTGSRAGQMLRTSLRVFICLATLLTYPIAMQPVVAAVEEVLMRIGFGTTASEKSSKDSRDDGYGAVGGDDNITASVSAVEKGEEGKPSSFTEEPIGRRVSFAGEDEDAEEEDLPTWLYYGVRAVLVLFTGFCATSVPNFGVVTSLLGSFSVTLGSFVLPPLFHLLVFGDRLGRWAIVADIMLFIIGVATCIFTTTATALDVAAGEV